MRVLVTGASGFVGGWIAEVLHLSGHHVRALYRRSVIPEHLARLVAEGAEPMRADLGRTEDVSRAVEGMGAVVHAAALTGDWGSLKQFMAQNYEPTVSLVGASREAGCRVFVYIGSVAVHGFGPHVDTTERGPYYPLFHPYQITKKLAEEYVLGQNAEGFRTTCIRPGDIYGPRDTTMLYKMLDAQRLGVRGTLGGGRSLTCPVYVEDLAEAVRLALHCEQSGGEVFDVTGGERVTWDEFLSYSAELVGVRPLVDPPIVIARAAAPVLTWLFRLLRIPAAPPITRYRVEHVAHDFHFDIGKARRILGYSPKVDWREGLRRAVAAYGERL